MQEQCEFFKIEPLKQLNGEDIAPENLYYNSKTINKK